MVHYKKVIETRISNFEQRCPCSPEIVYFFLYILSRKGTVKDLLLIFFLVFFYLLVNIHFCLTSLGFESRTSTNPLNSFTAWTKTQGLQSFLQVNLCEFLHMRNKSPNTLQIRRMSSHNILTFPPGKKMGQIKPISQC